MILRPCLFEVGVAWVRGGRFFSSAIDTRGTLRRRVAEIWVEVSWARGEEGGVVLKIEKSKGVHRCVLVLQSFFLLRHVESPSRRHATTALFGLCFDHGDIVPTIFLPASHPGPLHHHRRALQSIRSCHHTQANRPHLPRLTALLDWP